MKAKSNLSVALSLLAGMTLWSACGSGGSNNNATTTACASGQVSAVNYGCVTTCSGTTGYSGYGYGYGSSGYGYGSTGSTYGLVNGSCIPITVASGSTGTCPSTFYSGGQTYPLVQTTCQGQTGCAVTYNTSWCEPLSYFTQPCSGGGYPSGYVYNGQSCVP